MTLAQQMLGDHLDTFQKKKKPTNVLSAATSMLLHAASPSGPGIRRIRRCCQGKASDSDDPKRSLVARMGHPCGEDFLAKPFLAAHLNMRIRNSIFAT